MNVALPHKGRPSPNSLDLGGRNTSSSQRGCAARSQGMTTKRGVRKNGVKVGKEPGTGGNQTICTDPEKRVERHRDITIGNILSKEREWCVSK